MIGVKHLRLFLTLCRPRLSLNTPPGRHQDVQAGEPEGTHVLCAAAAAYALCQGELSLPDAVSPFGGRLGPTIGF